MPFLPFAASSPVNAFPSICCLITSECLSFHLLPHHPACPTGGSLHPANLFPTPTPLTPCAQGQKCENNPQYSQVHARRPPFARAAARILHIGHTRQYTGSAQTLGPQTRTSPPLTVHARRPLFARAAACALLADRVQRLLQGAGTARRAAALAGVERLYAWSATRPAHARSEARAPDP
eukprot:359596-Chlamydomonas_euryale.AAC.2